MLREQAQKLKSVSDVLEKEISEYDSELSTLQQTISRCDIELSLIHDAFHLKFGQMTDYQRNQAIEAMSNLYEVENMRSILQREESQVHWLHNEIERLSGLVPQKMLEDVDLEQLESKKRQLEEKCESLRARNAKKEKSIRNAEVKIVQTENELRRLQSELEIKQEQ